MSNHRKEKIEEIIKELAGAFITRESAGQSLITITRVEYFPKPNSALILYTVFPQEKLQAATDFLKRNRSEFREYLQEKSSLGRVPFIDFEEDAGEKNRQHLDDISSSINY